MASKADKSATHDHDQENRKQWTLSLIKAANAAGGGCFFSRDTMAFWGDRMSNFAVRCEGGEVFVERVKSGTLGGLVGARWRFTPGTGALTHAKTAS
jgi:hypothetical protein